MLAAAHDRIAEDRRLCGDLRAPVVHLGDLCDRGPNSAGVIRFLLAGQRVGAPWVALRGNHDALFSAFLKDPEVDGQWWLSANMGGSATLASYGVDLSGPRPIPDIVAETRLRVPAQHRAFLDGMLPYLETEHLILVHAGIRPGVPLEAQEEQELYWIRDPFLLDSRDHGKLVVHGHTPVEAPMHCGNRIALDTGAGFGRPLTAAVFEGRDCFILTDDGRVPLLPP